MDPNKSVPRYMAQTDRRRFLKSVAAAGAVVGVGVTVTAQQETDADFEFGGGIGGWRGRAPEAIAGEENPTLELEPGETYTVAWENQDGFQHNFVIIDGAGNEVVRSPIIEQEGFVQTVEFEATEAMTEYFCEIHPRSMRGAVDTGVDTDEPQNIVPEGESIGLQQVAEGLASPLGFEVAPGESDRRYVVDQPGQVYVHTDDGLRDQPFLDIGNRLVDLGIEQLNGYDERGLLGLAFHPDYQENGRVFVRYSAPVGAGTDGDGGSQTQEVDHIEVLAEFQVTDDGERVDPESEQVLLEIPSPQDNHNGGAVVFGPEDGYLYTSIGDGGDANDTGPGHVEDWYAENDGGNGQDTTENLLGSILRIDVDGQGTVRGAQQQYAIPGDNPLVNLDGHLDEQYALGFRNPWRMFFDRQGRLFLADACQHLY
jgi:glucose/arabinose dehydrogenase